MGENFARNIFMVSVLGILISLFVMFFAGGGDQITGEVIGNEECEGEDCLQEFKAECEDSDNGKVYSVKGSARYCDGTACSTEYDSCSTNNIVEWFCENNERFYEEKTCGFECDDGVCTEKVTKYKLITSTVSGGGGSSSSSGGGGTTAELQGEVYDLGELLLEQTLEVVKLDDINFNIGSQEYTLDVSDNTDAQVSFSYNSQTASINAGEEQAADLNSDGVYEVYIKVKTINLITGKITVKIRNY